MRTHRCPWHCITPPHLLKMLLEDPDKKVREAALSTLLATTQLRAVRSVQATFAAASVAPGNGRRTIFDCQGRTDLSAAETARSEDGPPSSDDSVNQAFDGLGAVRDFYKDVFDRNSIDDRGMRLNGYVHYGRNYNNAGWNGRVMVFGDGDGMRFTDFTKSLDVIGHELTHGVVDNTAGLTYHNQPGALNESMSDVFGSLVKQWKKKETAAQADWLIGAEVFTPLIGGDALRSMKKPGEAHARDPQPAHMDNFARMPDDEDNDNGGVHINSGIPNKAFYLVAESIGGFAWEAPGLIWYESLKASGEFTQFDEFADITYTQAERLFGANSVEQQAVFDAWRQVGIRIRKSAPAAAFSKARAADRRAAREEDALAALTKQIETMSAQIKVLTKEIESLKRK
jgi:Zn-dependent metalloprotease